MIWSTFFSHVSSDVKPLSSDVLSIVKDNALCKHTEHDLMEVEHLNLKTSSPTMDKESRNANVQDVYFMKFTQ